VSYSRQTWADGSGGGTPITAARLNTLEAGVETAAGVADTANSGLSGKANSSHTHPTSDITSFTEAVQDILGAALVAGTGMTVTYDDTAGTVTLTSTGGTGGGLTAEDVRDTIGTALLGSGVITVTVNDAGDTITISSTATANATDAALRDRTTHTGSQATSTITGLDTALSGKAAVSHTHVAANITDFTEAAQDAVAALLAGASGVTLNYDDTANTLTITGSGSGTTDAEVVRDTIGVAMVGAGVISITVNDAADTITISSTATANSTDAALRDRSTHTGTQLSSTISDLTESVQDIAAGVLVAGTGIVKTYDDTANTLTVAVDTDTAMELYYDGTNIKNSAGTTITTRPTTRPINLTGGPESARPSWMTVGSGGQIRDKHFVTVVP
jgi:hypothetical protein